MPSFVYFIFDLNTLNRREELNKSNHRSTWERRRKKNQNKFLFAFFPFFSLQFSCLGVEVNAVQQRGVRKRICSLCTDWGKSTKIKFSWGSFLCVQIEISLVFVVKSREKKFAAFSKIVLHGLKHVVHIGYVFVRFRLKCIQHCKIHSHCYSFVVKYFSDWIFYSSKKFSTFFFNLSGTERWHLRCRHRSD